MVTEFCSYDLPLLRHLSFTLTFNMRKRLDLPNISSVPFQVHPYLCTHSYASLRTLPLALISTPLLNSAHSPTPHHCFSVRVAINHPLRSSLFRNPLGLSVLLASSLALLLRHERHCGLSPHRFIQFRIVRLSPAKKTHIDTEISPKTIWNNFTSVIS